MKRKFTENDLLQLQCQYFLIAKLEAWSKIPQRSYLEEPAYESLKKLAFDFIDDSMEKKLIQTSKDYKSKMIQLNKENTKLKATLTKYKSALSDVVV